MKKKMKRISAMALTGAMCFGLFGCGDKESSDSEYKTLAQELGYGYLSKYDTIDDMNLDYVNSVSTAQGKLYLCGDYYDEASGTNSTKLYERDLASGTVKEIALPELVNNETTSEYIQQLSVCSDGSGYWIITNQYTFVSQMMPEAVPAEEPEETVEETQEEATPAEEAPAEGTPEEGTEAGDEPVAEAEGVSGQYQMQLLTNEVPAEEAPADDTAEVTALEGETDEETATEDAAVEDVAEDGAGGGVAISEDGSVESIDEGAYQEPEQKYFAKKCDMSGALLQTIDLTEISEEMEYFYCQAAVQDASGNLYLASDQNILCFGSDGSRKENIMNDSIYIQSMITTGDGTVLASGFNSEDGAMQVCRVENGSLTVMELTDMEKYANCYLYPGVGNTALMSDGTMLYSLDAATGQTTKLLSWLDSDINSNNISSVVSNSDDTILVLLQNYSYNSAEVHYELGTLTKTPVDQIPERTILTLGAEYLDDTLRNAVIDFNRKSDTYRVTMVDYSVYNTEENYSAGAEQLDRDVISGNCPDILSLSSGNAERYISKGALTDMTSLMEKDGEITMDSLLSGPMQAYMQDGKLYGMPYSFGLNTLYASAKLVGDRESWTIADMSQIIDGLDEDTKIVNWYIQTDFLTNLVYQNMDQFVDYSKATCSFDSDTFKSLMEVSAKLPESYEDNEFVVVDGSGDEMQQLQTGDTLMAMGYGVYDSYSIKNMYRLYTRENGIVRIGYPTDTGNGAILDINGGLAIGVKSKNQEGAWEFIKTMLSDEVQENQWGLPVTNAAFDKVLAQAMEQQYYTDENGEKVYMESTGYIGNTEYKMGDLTQEQADAFRDYVNGATVSGNYDTNIMDIVIEESAAYFAGDKTVDEVASLIQNKVSIYLGEIS